MKTRRKPLVSIVIPTYNRSHLLTNTLNSALNQSWREVEIIVIDDGSSDDTRAVVQPFESYITYAFQENKGRSAARNLGIKLSSGKYLVFLDSDDLLLPDGVRLQATFLEGNPDVDLVYGNGFTMTEDGRMGPLEPYVTPMRNCNSLDIYRQLIKKNLFAPHAGMVRRLAISRIAPFDESLDVLEDWDLWIRLAMAGSKIVYHDEKVVIYRRHSGNTRMDLLTELRSRIVIATKVIEGDLDFDVAIRLQQEFRLEFLYAVLASLSPNLIVKTLQSIVFPRRRLSTYGLSALPARCFAITTRGIALLAGRGACRLASRFKLVKYPSIDCC